MDIRFTLNDEIAYADVSPLTTLSAMLRETFGLLSVHENCKQGFCGQCIALVNNHPVSSCLVPAFSIRGSVVETVEGLVSKPEFIDIEKGFLEAGLSPCPYCAGNKAVLAEGIVREHSDLLRETIIRCIPQHWCSCSDTDSFVEAVFAAWNLRRKRSGHAPTR